MPEKNFEQQPQQINTPETEKESLINRLNRLAVITTAGLALGLGACGGSDNCECPDTPAAVVSEGTVEEGGVQLTPEQIEKATEIAKNQVNYLMTEADYLELREYSPSDDGRTFRTIKSILYTDETTPENEENGETVKRDEWIFSDYELNLDGGMTVEFGHSSALIYFNDNDEIIVDHPGKKDIYAKFVFTVPNVEKWKNLSESLGSRPLTDREALVLIIDPDTALTGVSGFKSGGGEDTSWYFEIDNEGSVTSTNPDPEKTIDSLEETLVQISKSV